MGRSTGSCFKIIACGSGDSVDRDDLDASESKGADKRGWSFRKRSARHRVLSNTVITETPSSGNKQSPESTAVSFQAPADSTISEKTSEILWTEGTLRLSTSVPKAATVSTLVTETTTEDGVLATKAAIEEETLATEAAKEDDTSVTEAVTEDDTSVDVNPDESAIVIQAAVRRFLAQRALVKHKKLVKLQAAIRGHLVRRRAVGTLRCVHAIVKVQALIRARHAHLSAEGSATEDKLDKKHGNDNHGMNPTEMKTTGTKQHPTYVSMEKLLSNRFACQLLESPKTEITFKLDSSKPNSAWKWLERWMSASATETEQAHNLESNPELHEQDKFNHPESQVESVIPSEDKPTVVKSDVEEAAVPCDSKENLIAHEETSSLVSDSLKRPQPVNTCMLSSKGSNLLPSETRYSGSVSQVEPSSLSDKPELEAEEPKRSMKRLAPEQADSDGRKFVFGSRKASNPAFIAAHSKFEELTSTSNSAKSINSSNQDLGVDSCADTVSSSHNNAIKTRDVELSENSVSHNSRVHVGGSECGTELSITSTLDSPDRSEVVNLEFETESKVLEEEIGNPTSSNTLDIEDITLDIEDKLQHTILGTELTYSISVPPEQRDSGIGADIELSKPVTDGDLSQVEYKLEENTSNAPINSELETGHPVYKSSPEASPRSHMTVPESQGTPASQVSTNTKKSRSDKKGSSQKRKSLSASKRSPINAGLDSGVRSSMEQLPKDHKTAKRRNSFGSPRPDHVDQEPRDSSSSNSLPSYMQATESARAKALAANGSPRSSPDVQDKEIYIKKRHSLPGTNGRQGSPRIQRSMSQAQQSTKGNGTNERKWQR